MLGVFCSFPLNFRISQGSSLSLLQRAKAFLTQPGMADRALAGERGSARTLNTWQAEPQPFHHGRLSLFTGSFLSVSASGCPLAPFRKQNFALEGRDKKTRH